MGQNGPAGAPVAGFVVGRGLRCCATQTDAGGSGARRARWCGPQPLGHHKGNAAQDAPYVPTQSMYPSHPLTRSRLPPLTRSRLPPRALTHVCTHVFICAGFVVLDGQNVWVRDTLASPSVPQPLSGYCTDTTTCATFVRAHLHGGCLSTRWLGWFLSPRSQLHSLLSGS